MRRASGCVVLAALLLAPAMVHAQSWRHGSFEIGAGPYTPDIDSEPGLEAPLPWEQIFGTRPGWMFRAGYSRAILTYPGSLEVGFSTGFFRRSDKGLQIIDDKISDIPSSDSTAFNIIPTTVTLTYRFDLLAERYPVPIAPYVRVAFERYNWWITNGSGGSAQNGATNGWSATAGLAFLLDIFDRQAARELAQETGIKHTYLFAELGKAWIDDFGSSSSWDLSDKSLPFSFGLLLAY